MGGGCFASAAPFDAAAGPATPLRRSPSQDSISRLPLALEPRPDEDPRLSIAPRGAAGSTRGVRVVGGSGGGGGGGGRVGLSAAGVVSRVVCGSLAGAATGMRVVPAADGGLTRCGRALPVPRARCPPSG